MLGAKPTQLDLQYPDHGKTVKLGREEPPLAILVDDPRLGAHVGSGEGLRGAGPPRSRVPRPPTDARGRGKGGVRLRTQLEATNQPFHEPRLSNAIVFSGVSRKVEEG